MPNPLARAGLPKGLQRLLLGSLVLHLGFIVVAMAGNFSGSSKKPDKKFITTKLVRLGEERPPELLPRKTQPPPPTKTPTAPALTPPKPDITPKPPEPKVAAAKDRVKEMAQLSSALSRLKENLDTPEGSKDGSQFGNSAVASSLVANKYYNEVGLCLENNYFIEGVGSARVAGLKALVVLWIDSTGKFIRHKIEESSGSEIFDRATSRAVDRCGKVSPPPPEMRRLLREDGVAIEFKPD